MIETLVPLSPPPGLYRIGTAYQARGRWYDGDLVRWYEGTLQPVGGWAPMLWSEANVVIQDSLELNARPTFLDAFDGALSGLDSHTPDTGGTWVDADSAFVIAGDGTLTFIMGV